MSLGASHQPIEVIRVERMLGVEVLPDGLMVPLLPTRTEDCVDGCDFAKRLSLETQRILSEFKQL